MPAQHAIFGRPVTLRMPPRRFQALFVVVLFIIVNLSFYGPPKRENLPTYDQVADAVKHPAAYVPNFDESTLR